MSQLDGPLRAQDHMARKNKVTAPMFDRRSPDYRFSGLVVLTVSVLARLIFWSRTHFTIEDSLIIGRMARNFVTHGELTYNLGERVSAWTTPLFRSVGVSGQLGSPRRRHRASGRRALRGRENRDRHAGDAANRLAHVCPDPRGLRPARALFPKPCAP